MSEAARSQIGVRPPTQTKLEVEESQPPEMVTPPARSSPELEAAYARGVHDGYKRGREIKLAVEQQRMDCLLTLERVLAVADDPEQVRKLIQHRLDAVTAEKV